MSKYISPKLTSESRAALRVDTVKHVVEIINGYLLAAVLLIFSLGLYELFISKIEVAAETEGAPKVLLIYNFESR